MGERPKQKRPVSEAKDPSRTPDPGVESPDGRLSRLSALAAGAVSATPAAVIQQKAARSPHTSSATALQRQADRRNMTGMPDDLKSGIEAASGMDLSGVRVHRNSGAPEQLGAEAYAQGTDIHLGPGQERHLPHEAWHVVQQAQGRVRPTLQMAGVSINDDPSLEAEAEAMGKGVAQAKVPANKGPLQMAAAPGSAVVQRARGDYKALWDKDPALAKMSITQTSIAGYMTRAQEFEQALGAGLFSHALAHEGANALIDAIETLIGSTQDANRVFGSMPSDTEAGAIPSDKVAEARAQGNLREKMYMVYAAIRSGAVAYRLAQEEVVAIPRRQTQQGGLVPDTHALTNRHLRRRDSVSTQDRVSNWDNLTRRDRMGRQELDDKNAPLSSREKLLTQGSQHPHFVPGSAGYLLEGNRNLQDTSTGGAGATKSFAQYQRERLAPLAAGLSGSTDWYFNLARQLGLDDTDRRKLRLAALGQMLVNRDHSYHEIMHEARTQGKLNDYVDELPAGYATLAPLDQAQIAGAAGKPLFPGDLEAAAFNTEDAKGQAPTGLAQQHGLPTSSGFIHLAGPATHRAWLLGGGVKGTHYPAILRALDAYNTAATADLKKDELRKVKRHSERWLARHNPNNRSSKKKRVEPLEWLVLKATAMLADQPGPPPPVWVDAAYDDPAADPVAEAALYAAVPDASAAYDADNDRAGGTMLVNQFDQIRDSTPGLGEHGAVKQAGYDEENMVMMRGAFVNAGNNQKSMKAAKEFLALNKYTKEGFETYNPVLIYADDDNAAWGIAYKQVISGARFNPMLRQQISTQQGLNDAITAVLPRVKRTQLPKARKEAELAVRALMRMNPYQGGVLWRGGGTGGGAGITSFSKEFETSFAAQQGYNPAVCLIRHSSGRDISFISSNYGELEVVFPPGTNFNEAQRYQPGQWPAIYSAMGGPHANVKDLLLVTEA
ncbi:eCIS core domain-containing protein [Roseobacter sinensis]|uniref:DUF4157 domain-containing protein n=1 Tax=Roseobacter sinensis TaxID=2931391 RepID=A0ABT3BD67_9RHOB|nr:DUF4157 domain-containing protein [Roseobacter sp. WL0113]MCV3271518.1 DUF4157 domain-containing protein [Roseobacter sp. WL0113]